MRSDLYLFLKNFTIEGLCLLMLLQGYPVGLE